MSLKAIVTNAIIRSVDVAKTPPGELEQTTGMGDIGYAYRENTSKHWGIARGRRSSLSLKGGEPFHTSSKQKHTEKRTCGFCYYHEEKQL